MGLFDAEAGVEAREGEEVILGVCIVAGEAGVLGVDGVPVAERCRTSSSVICDLIASRSVSAFGDTKWKVWSLGGAF